MVRFIIIRHGYSAFNKARAFTGQYDAPLDEIGYKQAEDTARYVLANYQIDKIVSSDLSRAVDTARPVAKALGLPIERERELRELDTGAWTGLTFEEVAARYPDTFATFCENVGYSHPDGGESYAQLIERAARIMARLAAENEGKTVLVVTHGGFVRCLMCALENVSLDDVKTVPHVANASITVVEYENGKGTPTLVGYKDHLQGGATEFRVTVV